MGTHSCWKKYKNGELNSRRSVSTACAEQELQLVPVVYISAEQLQLNITFKGRVPFR